MSHKINWFEIPVHDLERATNFYNTLLDINLELLDLGDTKMAMFTHGPGDVAGALVQNPEFYKPSQDGALLYLNANPDLQLALDKISPSTGGSITIPKRMISPDHGHMAVIIDSEGNRIALHSDH